MLRRLRNAYKKRSHGPEVESESMSTFSPKHLDFKTRLTLHFLYFRAQKSEVRAAIFKNLCKMTSSSPKQESKFSSLFFFYRKAIV